MRFDEFDLPAQVIEGTRTAGFTECTPIQELSLPISLSGADMVGQAQTGTGKTAAFLISVYTRLLTHERAYKGSEPAPRALIIAPTRELVVQIEKDAQVLGAHTGLNTMVVFGGMNYDKQRQELAENPDILVGTPGRLIDYFKQRIYTLKGIEILVVDEADRMFDMGFIDDIRYMLRSMPKPGERQTLLFSATFPQRVQELAYEHMHEAQSVSVTPDQVTADRVTQVLYLVANHEKFSLLAGVLGGIIGGKTMVFVNTKRTGEDIEYWLEANGIQARFISGDVPQKKRLTLLDAFKSGELPVLIATDVASRGLHIDAVSHVINYDVPQDPEDYVHRIGRTARAGAKGDAITFGCETYSEYLIGVEKFIGNKIPIEAPEDELFVEVKQPHRRRVRKDGPGGRPGGRGGESSGRGGQRRDGRSGGGRSEGGRSRGGGAPRPEGDAAKSPVQAAGGPNPPAEGEKKRRRRRRRKGSGQAPATGESGARVIPTDGG
ncbi:MAG: DEAD/DEAH box helicase [Nitrospirota bacterium]|nr:DEAD/DEAH box helicase [Nitrospirota bacterium]